MITVSRFRISALSLSCPLSTFSPDSPVDRLCQLQPRAFRMTEGPPCALEPRPNRLGRKREVADEIGVTSVAPVGGSADGLLQVAGSQARIEIV